MLENFTYELVMAENGVWDCYTYNITRNCFDHDDFTGVGLSAAEAYQDWLSSNDIHVDGTGRHTYAIATE